MNPIISSSVDPTKLSNTIKGIIISSSSIIILFASVKLHTTLSTDQVAVFADQIAQTVSAVGIAYGAIHTLYGVVLKVIHRITVAKTTV